MKKRPKPRWKINFAQFYPKNFEYRSYCDEYTIPAPGNRRAAAIFHMLETQMGWYVGGFAVFERGDFSKPILNLKDITVCGGRSAVGWINSNLLYAIEYCCGKRSLHGLPFLIFDLEAGTFAYIPVENAFPYRIKKRGTALVLIEDQPDSRFPSHDRERFELDELEWRPYSAIKGRSRLYLKGLRALARKNKKAPRKKR